MAYGFWLLILFILLVGRLTFLVEPLGVSLDESNYLAFAEKLSQGGVLYIDAIDRKAPGIFWLYGAIAGVGGSWNLFAVHATFFVLVTLLCVLAYRIGGKTAAILYAIFSACFPREVISCNAELPMLLFLILSQLLWVKAIRPVEGRRLGFAVASGICLGIAILFKQYAVLIFGGMALTILFYERAEWRQRVGHWISISSVAAVGVIAVWASVYFHFRLQGADEAFWNHVLFDGLQYVGSSREVKNEQTGPWIAIGGMLASWPLLWWAGFFRARAWTFKSAHDAAALGAGLGALLTIFLSGRYYTHYFVPLIWYFSIWAAPAVHELWKRRGSYRFLVVAFSLFPFLFYSFFNLERDRFSKSWSFSRENQAKVQRVGNWIRENSQPTDRILVWGMAPQLYVTSERGASGRFIFADYVSGRIPGFKSPESRPLPGAMEKYLEDLEKNPPLYFVDTSSAGLNDYQFFPLDRFTDLKKAIETQYEFLRTQEGIGIWRHRSAEGFYP